MTTMLEEEWIQFKDPLTWTWLTTNSLSKAVIQLGSVLSKEENTFFLAILVHQGTRSGIGNRVKKYLFQNVTFPCHLCCREVFSVHVLLTAQQFCYWYIAFQSTDQRRLFPIWSTLNVLGIMDQNRALKYCACPSNEFQTGGLCHYFPSVLNSLDSRSQFHFIDRHLDASRSLTMLSSFLDSDIMSTLDKVHV